MKESTFVKVDSHAHITSDELYDKVDVIIKEALAQGVYHIINICTDKVTWERGVALKKRFPEVIFNAFAITPHDADDLGESVFPLVEQAAHKKEICAIGETGLDSYYEHAPLKKQRAFFEKHLILAQSSGLPLVVHMRGDQAFDELRQMSRSIKVPLLLHCFTGTKRDLDMALDHSWMVSISGIITFKKSVHLQELVSYIPLDCLLIETDAPYLAPEPFRGEINTPKRVHEVAVKIAELKKLSLEEVCLATTKNACKFFRLSCNIK